MVPSLTPGKKKLEYSPSPTASDGRSEKLKLTVKKMGGFEGAGSKG